MTQIETVTLSVAYVLPLVVLGLLFANLRQPRRWLPILVLTALPVFYTGHYILLQAIQGWPVNSAPPGEFTLLGFDVREPEPDADGEILIWVRDTGQASPRVHRLPYSRELHESLSAAGKRFAQGIPQAGRHGVAARKEQRTGASDRGDTLSFYDQEPRQLPAKGGKQP